MSTASDVPPEIWCHIGQFVRPADRPYLALVNRALYGIIVSDLYTHVEVVGRNQMQFVHAFQTLEREQNLVKRLRKLTIWVNALNEVIHSNEEETSLAVSSEKDEEKSVIQRPKWINKVRYRRNTQSTSEVKPQRSTFIDKQQLFTNVLAKAEHLADLSLIWKMDSGYCRASPTTSCQLVSLLWDKTANNLRSLTLDMVMFNLSEALRSPPKLGNLEELHIKITLEKHGAFRANAARILTDTILPFINSLAPQLSAFSLTSLCNINLDPFFQGMEPTPLLRRLSLCLAFQVADMWSAAALQAFFRSHATIQHLSLRYADCCSEIYRHNWFFHDHVLVGEAFTGSNAVEFTQLESLELGLRFKLMADNLLGSYVTRFCSSVESLTLLDRTLTFSQIKVVLAPFRERLKFLTMFVDALTPELLCLLATTFPTLQALTLRVQQFAGPFDAVRRGNANGTHQDFMDEILIQQMPGSFDVRRRDSSNKHQDFLDKIQTQLLPEKLEALRSWKLQEISVLEFAYGKGEVPARDIMQLIATIVPNVVSWNV